MPDGSVSGGYGHQPPGPQPERAQQGGEVSVTEPVYQSVRDYIAAKKAGDTATTDRIIREATDRFNTRTTDGSEYAELFRYTFTPPLPAEGQ